MQHRALPFSLKRLATAQIAIKPNKVAVTYLNNMHTRVRILITALVSRKTMTLLTPICLPNSFSWKFNAKLSTSSCKVIKNFMDFSSTQIHPPRERIGKIVIAVKPRLYHAYNERQFGIHKILKAKQSWHHFINKKYFSLFPLVSFLPAIVKSSWNFTFFRECPFRLMTNKEAFRFERTHTAC